MRLWRKCRLNGGSGKTTKITTRICGTNCHTYTDSSVMKQTIEVIQLIKLLQQFMKLYHIME